MELRGPLTRIRWAGVGRLAALLALGVLVAAWPRLRADPPALPTGAVRPIAPAPPASTPPEPVVPTTTGRAPGRPSVGPDDRGVGRKAEAPPQRNEPAAVPTTRSERAPRRSSRRTATADRPARKPAPGRAVPPPVRASPTRAAPAPSAAAEFGQP